MFQPYPFTAMFNLSQLANRLQRVTTQYANWVGLNASANLSTQAVPAGHQASLADWARLERIVPARVCYAQMQEEL